MNKQYIDKIIDERLGGDRTRVVELFQNEDIIDELKRNSSPEDWFHFESKTYDGVYLIKIGDGFAIYYQERGRAQANKWFKKLTDAAFYCFKSEGYIAN